MNRPEGIVALVNGPVLKPFIFLVLLVTVAVLTVGCGSQTKATPVPTAEPALTPTLIPTPEPVVTSTPKPSPTPTATPVPTLTPAPPPTPTATPAPVAFTPAQIFTRVSPSVAFIQTPVGSGSGVLIQDGYVVTNAHVVWPFQEVRIVFSDGTEYLDTPVANWDLMGDLAVLGPIDTTIAPVKLSDGEDLVIGSDLFLIGYPAEGEDFPQPTITRGILSRFRQWEPLEITYFQTDAAIAGGQSGGVLVSVASEVIGISGFELSEARFGVVASAADVLPRVNMLIANRDVAHLGNRRLPLEGGQRDQVFDLRSRWGGQTYVINEPVGTTIEVEVESDNDAAFYIVDALGNLLTSVDETYSGLESGSVTTEIDAPYFLVLGQFSDEEGSFRVRSNQDLLPFQDPDDRTIVSVGETVPASLDRPRDVDNFSIWLSAGQVIQVTVDTVNFDAFGIIAFPGARDDQMAFDDDSGGGVFGTDAKVTYQAPHSGNYFIVVQDANGTKVGGYLVTVSKAPEGAAVSATFPPATATADEGAALPSMLLTLEDLPPGVTLEREGFETDTEYERIFLAVNETFNLGSSRVSGIEIDVELYQSDADAQDVVVIIDGLDPSVFAKVLAGDLAEGDIPGIAGIPEIILMDSLDLPVIGDLGGGLFMKMNATEGEFEGFLLFFAQGNILAGLTATGPAGQIHLEDVVPLAELMAAKVRAQTADPASSINALVIEATEDSYVVADLADDTDPQEFRSQNYGDLEVLKTWYAWGVSEDERLVSVDLVKFDLSELKDLDIESISFQLFAQQADLNQPARLVDVHVVDGQWSEGDVTYESRPPWEIVPVATAPVYGADGWYSWNVTGSVINAVRRGEISFAIALRSATQGSEEQVVFASTEAPGKTPRMLVAYRGLPSTTTAASESEALIVEATEDSYVVTDLADDTDPQGFGRQNYGDLEFLKTWYAWGVVEEERLLSVDLVKFDLEEIQGLDIESVSFQLFARQADLNETARLVDVHNVTGGWSEAEVTYNLRPPWDLVPIATAAIYGGGGWYSWNVTGSVIAAARQGEISFAIALRSATQGSEEQVLFVSTEALDKAPRMLVTYTTPRSGATAGLAPSPEAQERFDAGLAFGEQNKYENAIAEYDQAIELYPEFAEAFNNRGVAYAHLDQLERAIRDYDSAILLNPESANAYSNSCSAYIGLEKHDRAIQDCDDAIQLDSDFSDAYTNRGTAYFNLGQDTLAIKDLDDAIRLDPQLGVAYAGRAFAYTMLGNDAAAQADIDRAVELGVDRNSLETDVENLKLER